MVQTGSSVEGNMHVQPFQDVMGVATTDHDMDNAQSFQDTNRDEVSVAAYSEHLDSMVLTSSEVLSANS